MNKKKKLQLESLIEEGEKFTFANNSAKHLNITRDGFYYLSEASLDLNAWISKVENFVMSNYNEDNAPVTTLKSVDKKSFHGGSQNNFIKELNKVKGAIKSCKDIEPNKKILKNELVTLLSSKLFYSILIPTCGIVSSIAFSIGTNNGKEKNYAKDKEIDQLRDTISILKKIKQKPFK